MEGGYGAVIDKAQELGDLELAALLCLVGNEHCLVEADPDEIYRLDGELRLVRNTLPCFEYAPTFL